MKPHHKFVRALSIRQKIMLGFGLFLLIAVFIGYKSYSEISLVQRKLQLIETSYRLYRVNMEMRQAEESFFSCGDPAELDIVVQKIIESYDIIDKQMLPLSENMRGRNFIELIHAETSRHKQLVALLAQNVQTGDLATSRALSVEISSSGDRLLLNSRDFSRFERARIDSIIAGIKRNNLLLFSAIIISGALLIPGLARKIVSPLVEVQKATKDFIAGDFKPLPVKQAHDETRDVILAFNSMIAELDKQQDIIVQAEKLNSLGIFTSGIAHELNNPLNNISTSCQIILSEFDTLDSGFQKKLLSNIEREVDRARDIVKGLLDFARDKEFAVEQINVRQLVESTLKLVSGDLPPGIFISSDVAPNISVRSDLQKMQQALLNLIINAMQAMPQGGEISISATVGRTPDMVSISVSDTGPGVPEDILPNIFDPFFTTKGTEGTGLGLSIAYGIAHKHGGEISVHNRPGGGATFVVEIPGQEEPS